MDKMITVGCSDGQATTVQVARRLMDGEGMKYNEQSRKSRLVAIGEREELVSVSRDDVWNVTGVRRADGEFGGSCNMAWIITAAERDALRVINQRKAAKEAQRVMQVETENREMELALQNARGIGEVLL